MRKSLELAPEDGSLVFKLLENVMLSSDINKAVHDVHKIIEEQETISPIHFKFDLVHFVFGQCLSNARHELIKFLDRNESMLRAVKR